MFNITVSDWKFDDKISKIFDKHVRQSVPGYDNIQSIVCNMSDFFIQNGDMVYDLGCSTGETIRNINERHSDKLLRFIGIDNSMPMIEIAKTKNENNPNIHFVNKNLEEYKFKEKSNLILSVLVMQFLPIEKREYVVKNIYNNLNKGGAFIYVEKIYSQHGRTQEMFTQIYHDYKEEHSLSAQEIRDKDKSLRGVMNPISKEDNLKMLKETGFIVIDEFFRYLNFIGFVAIK